MPHFLTCKTKEKPEDHLLPILSY